MPRVQVPRGINVLTGTADLHRNNGSGGGGGSPGPHYHVPGDIVPHGAGSDLDADYLDGYSSAYFQPSDGDLTALAALTGTGYARRTGADTWVLDTTTGTHGHAFHIVPTGSGSGPYTLPATPVTGAETVHVNLLRQRRKASAPVYLNEYYMSAPNQITFGWDVSGAYICVDYQTGVVVDHMHVIGEEISGTGTTVYLLAIPQVATEVLFMNELRLRRLPSGSPGLNEYTISGNAVTLAAPGKQSSDYMTADYLK